MHENPIQPLAPSGLRTAIFPRTRMNTPVYSQKSLTVSRMPLVTSA